MKYLDRAGQIVADLVDIATEFGYADLMISGKPTSDDLLHLDIDARLVSLWTEAWQVTEWDSERIAPFLRLAYFLGYRDALTERHRGALYRAHGQLPPPTEQRGSGA